MNLGILFVIFGFVALAHSQQCRRDLFDPFTCRYMIKTRRSGCNDPYVKSVCATMCCGGTVPTKQPPPPTKRPPPPPGGGCGKTFYQGSRVIAGRNCGQGEAPYQLLLKSNGRPGCGASLISTRHAITAAHCIRYGSRYTIVAGLLNRNRPGSDAQEIPCTAKTHPGWNSRSFENDVAVLTLQRPVRLTNNIQPICLPDRLAPDNSECMLSGFGKIYSSGQMHSQLQCARMRVINRDTCNRKNFANIRVRVTDKMICGGGQGRISGCQGDSGGPLACNVNGRMELHGAVSHGSRNCDSSKTYTVFGSVHAARDWIRQQTGL